MPLWAVEPRQESRGRLGDLTWPTPLSVLLLQLLNLRRLLRTILSGSRRPPRPGGPICAVSRPSGAVHSVLVQCLTRKYASTSQRRQAEISAVEQHFAPQAAPQDQHFSDRLDRPRVGSVDHSSTPSKVHVEMREPSGMSKRSTSVVRTWLSFTRRQAGTVLQAWRTSRRCREAWPASRPVAASRYRSSSPAVVI